MKNMKLPLILIAPIILALFGCPVPNLSQVAAPATPQGSSTSTTASETILVTTDAARNQGVLVSSGGTRTDIKAVADDGTTVSCADALTIAVMNDGTSTKGSSGNRDSIVIGTRADGNPGAWGFSGGKIRPVIDEDTGAATSSLPQTDDHDGTFRGQFGWTYHVMGVSEDGKIMIGYAENKKGFSRGRFTNRPQGTTVGVYWKASHHPRRPFLMVSRAHIIGTFDTSHMQSVDKHVRHWIDWVKKHVLRSRWFLLDFLTDYLIMVQGRSPLRFDQQRLSRDRYRPGQPAGCRDNRHEGQYHNHPERFSRPGRSRARLHDIYGTSVAQGGSLPVTLAIQNLRPPARDQQIFWRRFLHGHDEHLLTLHGQPRGQRHCVGHRGQRQHECQRHHHDPDRPWQHLQPGRLHLRTGGCGRGDH